MTIRPTVALMYDFDGTLAAGNMQEYDFIPALGISPKEFWDEAGVIAHEQEMDKILAYMYLMLEKARARKISVLKQSFVDFGKGVKLFEGVETWFERVNAYAGNLGLQAEHYIISSGLREMIEGTSIYPYFRKVYASSFYYDVNGVAVWPAMALNYTSKTQFLFRINKSALEISDDRVVNQFVPQEQRPVPFRNMIYIGDGFSDVPCMKLVKVNGGHSIAVHLPDDREEALRLIHEERVDFAAPADYREGGEMDRLVKAILDKVAAVEELRRYQPKQEEEYEA